jgi:hypothetical protein
MVAFILLCIAVIVLGVAAGRPYGWLALGLAVIALILTTAGWPHGWR